MNRIILSTAFTVAIAGVLASNEERSQLSQKHRDTVNVCIEAFQKAGMADVNKGLFSNLWARLHIYEYSTGRWTSLQVESKESIAASSANPSLLGHDRRLTCAIDNSGSAIWTSDARSGYFSKDHSESAFKQYRKFEDKEERYLLEVLKRGEAVTATETQYEVVEGDYLFLSKTVTPLLENDFE